MSNTKDLGITVEWRFICHEILLLFDNFREMMNDQLINHCELLSQKLPALRLQRYRAGVQYILGYVIMAAVYTRPV